MPGVADNLHVYRNLIPGLFPPAHLPTVFLLWSLPADLGPAGDTLKLITMSLVSVLDGYWGCYRPCCDLGLFHTTWHDQESWFKHSAILRPGSQTQYPSPDPTRVAIWLNTETEITPPALSTPNSPSLGSLRWFSQPASRCNPTTFPQLCWMRTRGRFWAGLGAMFEPPGCSMHCGTRQHHITNIARPAGHPVYHINSHILWLVRFLYVRIV